MNTMPESFRTPYPGGLASFLHCTNFSSGEPWERNEKASICKCGYLDLTYTRFSERTYSGSAARSMSDRPQSLLSLRLAFFSTPP
jgi:hypothetical protein